MLFAQVLSHIENVLLWGLIATAALTGILQGSQSFGFSRLSLPFLLGTLFTGKRNLAQILGFALYMLGGWLFAFLYFLVFTSLDLASWWFGALLGSLHALFLLVAVLPLLPYVHPRMASEYDGPSTIRRLEPPGFMGINYGYRTPVSTLIAHAVYGAILGIFYSLPF